MNEEKRLRHLRYVVRKKGLSIVTGESENISIPNTGKWKIDSQGQYYRKAFVNVKTYALKDVESGEIITPYERIRYSRSGSAKIISDITIDRLEEIVALL
ncbi:MAG: hypothetical protein K5659_07620 [Lachnospiraceae bacterium]|nr:hypothetical protein [Lachnospiraceae bacterium]